MRNGVLSARRRWAGRLSPQVSKRCSLVAYHTDTGSPRLEIRKRRWRLFVASHSHRRRTSANRRLHRPISDRARAESRRTALAVSSCITDYDCNIATPTRGWGRCLHLVWRESRLALSALKPQGDVFQVTEIWKSFGHGSVMRNEWQTSILLDGFLYGLDNVGGAAPSRISTV